MTASKRREPAGAPFPIAGIGCSAGGLEALTALLSRLRGDTGMAFVIVQHLDPNRESLLPQLLQKHSTMPVAQARNGARVLPNRVYVIPPGAHMSISSGRLRLLPRPSAAPASSVDVFLKSLAAERGHRAVGVILSGTADDGAAGVKAIKAEGGVVMAQDERSAAHGGMPHSAVSTGAVDHVLTPERIADELARVAAHPGVTRGVPGLDTGSRALDRILAVLRRDTGVDFGLYKPSTVGRRITRRLLVHRLESLEQYADLLDRSADEARALFDDMLIHVTQFYREPRALAALREKVMPRVVKSLPPDAPIRAWVAGCSTGEEAYSLAIMILDFLEERGSRRQVQIFATDISESALAAARLGVYPEASLQNLPSRLARRYFTDSGGGRQVAKRVRDACVFARQDLTKDPPFANVDVVSCCNVLIYLGRTAQKRIFPMFHYALRPWGALVLGSSESAADYPDLFAPADKRSRLYWRKPSASRAAFAPRTEPPGPAPGKPAGPSAAPSAWAETDVQRAADRVLLSRFAPAGVILDKDLNILHFRGRVSRFLAPSAGKASLSLLKMLPLPLAGVVRELLRAARRSDSPARVEGVALGEEGVRGSLELLSFRLPLSREKHFILLFEEEAAGGRAGDGKRRGAARAVEPPTLKRVRAELASAREYLQTLVEEHEGANEELKSANEEIVSSNEELQSTNEELEIAKEELQAANEELSTLNEELQTRNDDLAEVNNDLVNLLASVHLPILMLGLDLRLRRYTPMAEKVMNLVPTDVGRPFGDIKPKLELPRIEEIIAEVIDTAAMKELDVRDARGRSYRLRVRPYKTTDNKIDGAVLVFIDAPEPDRTPISPAA